jgi:hypothetical protein
VVAIIPIVRIGGCNSLAIGSRTFKRHHFSAVCNTWKRPQQNGVDPTENGSVGSNADGQRENRGECQTRAFEGNYIVG